MLSVHFIARDCTNGKTRTSRIAGLQTTTTLSVIVTPPFKMASQDTDIIFSEKNFALRLCPKIMVYASTLKLDKVYLFLVLLCLHSTLINIIYIIPHLCPGIQPLHSPTPGQPPRPPLHEGAPRQDQ